VQKREENLHERTLYNYLTILRAWARDTTTAETPIGELSLANVDASHIRRYIDGADGSKASTCRLRLSILRMFFDWAQAEGITFKNPARITRKVNVKKMSFTQKEVKKKVAFSDDEIAAIQRYIEGEITKLTIDLERIDPLLRAKSEQGKLYQHMINTHRFWSQAIAIGRWTGLRISDICNLEWDCFSSPGMIVCHTLKRDKRISVPIHPLLGAALATLQRKDEQYVFPDQKWLYESKNRTRLQKQFEKLLRRAGIQDKSFHCLRSSAAGDMVERMMAAGKTREAAEKDAAALLGHSSTDTTREHYLNGEDE
jgi:integrase